MTVGEPWRESDGLPEAPPEPASSILRQPLGWSPPRARVINRHAPSVIARRTEEIP